MNQRERLSDMNPGEMATVSAVTMQGDMRRRLMDIGLLPHAPVECVGISPGGDPVAYVIAGAVIALRRRDAAAVTISPRGVPSWD